MNLTPCDSDTIRREISPSAIVVGQIVQVRIQLRLFKQPNGSFTFRELLKGVYILNDGLSMVGFRRTFFLLFTSFQMISRDLATGILGGNQRTKRNLKFYMVARNKGKAVDMGKGGDT